MAMEVIKYGDVSKFVEEGNQLALLKLVTLVVNEAKTGAPFETGQLRNSIMGRVLNKEEGYQGGPKISEFPIKGQGYVGTAVLHGIYNEFGTHKMPALPFLRPAISRWANGVAVAKTVIKLQNESVEAGMRKGPRPPKKEFK